LHSLGAIGLCKDAHQVEIRPLVHRIPLIARALPHREAIVMLGYRAGHLRARVGEELRPRVGIPTSPISDLLWRELRKLARLVVGAGEKLVVWPIAQGVAVDRHMVIVFTTALIEHVA